MQMILTERNSEELMITIWIDPKSWEIWNAMTKAAKGQNSSEAYTVECWS